MINQDKEVDCLNENVMKDTLLLSCTQCSYPTEQVPVEKEALKQHRKMVEQNPSTPFVDHGHLAGH